MNSEVRAYFQTHDFTEVETPARLAAAGTDPFLENVECADHTSLQTSPEFAMKALLAYGQERIYQICKAFRGQEITDTHNPEFTILEFYRAWEPMTAVVDDVERLIKICVPRLANETFLRRRMADIVKDACGVDLNNCRDDVSFRHELQHRGLFEPRATDSWYEMFFEMMVTYVDPYLASQPPTFVTHWPAQVAVLAKRAEGDPALAMRFELYVDGLELCNGFEELTDPVEQRLRFEADLEYRRSKGLPEVAMPEDFLQAMEWGLPPSSGVAVGLDRVLMLRMQTPTISEVLPFWWGKGRF